LLPNSRFAQESPIGPLTNGGARGSLLAFANEGRRDWGCEMSNTQAFRLRALGLSAMLIAGASIVAAQPGQGGGMMGAGMMHTGGGMCCGAVAQAGAGTCCGGTAGGTCCGGGAMPAGGNRADMQLFHELFASRETIARQVTRLPNGVESVTESSDPAVAKTLQAHVASMAARVSEARPIHQRDPLFREIFKHAAMIDIRHELTDRGIRVVETSSDPYVATLIQAHADVVSGFIANGHAEMMKNHPVPER
jgi:hypothetical protein